MTFGEKLGQSVIHLFRVLFAYFMMLCVMTMNVWLLVAVVTGAIVGYGVGKPLVANRIDDAITSYGYDSAAVKIHRRGNRTERSKSWRYQPIVRSNRDVKTRLTESDETFLDDTEEFEFNSMHNENRNNGAEIIWIRRSTEELRLKQSKLSDVFDDSDETHNFDSIRSEGRHSSRSSNRFRSTSKVINDSFRSNSELRTYSTSASTSLNLSFESQNADTSTGKKDVRVQNPVQERQVDQHPHLPVAGLNQSVKKL